MAIKARNPISPHGRGNAPIGSGDKGRPQAGLCNPCRLGRASAASGIPSRARAERTF